MVTSLSFATSQHSHQLGRVALGVNRVSEALDFYRPQET